MEDNNDDDFLFNDLFPIEKISVDFDRLFSDNHHGDENLDSTTEKHGLNGTFPRTFIITTMKRETTPSRRCVIEKQIH
ncbi:unnamed protein product [Rotaria sp. Silwood1]|nr:unnamed protein product [Rotaria sp. Silwood1]CAF1628000.1 unnamed protein product [Rotaria sp. Silwood1]CAF1629681.1 unnamed protein product [Rotaria sp. Silwood1]CAF3894375.1 unnamed protein product [Rotaria sp. Silwood1]CAF5066375.1 unnamed protein product [Rotaria sp. Silwood1]